MTTPDDPRIPRRNDVADPAGLDAAIEAAARVLYDPHHLDTHPSALAAALDEAEPIVRAAAPHVRRAVLLEAADELGCMWSGKWSDAAKWLRERAERETT